MDKLIDTRYPRQKLPFKKKNKKWRKTHLDWADKNSRLNSETIRKRQIQKKVNIDFFNGKVHKEDIKAVLNPANIEKFYVPNDIQHYPIVVPRLNVLVGEEKAKKFDWRVTVLNPNSISSIKENKRKLVSQKLQELISLNYTEEEIEKELEKFNDYMNFEWQDIREKRGNVILKHYIKELNVPAKLSDGFKDVMLHGEEAFLFDIKNGNPVFEKLNPLKTFVLRHGYSRRYKDADVIVIDDYWSIGKTIDYYYSDLKPKDIDYLEERGHIGHGSSSNNGDLFPEDIDDREGIELARTQILEDHLDVVAANTSGFLVGNNYFDNNGNVRVLRVFWSSYKQIFKVTYFDEDGDQQIKYRDENYIPDPTKGETVEKFWIRQWWQGTKIADKIYVDMKPRPIQYNKIGNPGFSHPGIVGKIFSDNEQKVVSLLDRAKPFNILYDAAWYRLMEMYAKWLGPLIELDKAKFPEGWNMTKSLYFAKKAGVLLVDSFKEGKKGQSTGKLAGVVGNTTGRVLQTDISGYIKTNIELMEYAKSQMDEILGIPQQRLGAIENRQTVGGVEHSIRQSNYVTESLFKEHEEVKADCLKMLLETAKIALKGNKKKLSYIGDDLTNQLMDIDGDDIAEEDYGLVIGDGSDNAQLEQNLNQLAHAALQSQTLRFSTITKIFTSPSLIEIQRLIEKDEREAFERNQQSEEQANKVAQEQIASQERSKQEEMSLKKYEIDERSRIEELKLISNMSNEDVEDMAANDLEIQKFDLERKETLAKLEQGERKLDDAMKMHKDNLAVKKRQSLKSNSN